MFIEIIKFLLSWITSYFEFIETPSDDLEDIATLEVESKLQEIRKRKSISEVDALPTTCELECEYVLENVDPYPVQRQGLHDILIPKYFDEFIEFFNNHHDHIIQKSPEFIFRGEFLKQKRIAIKRLGSDHIQLDKEMKIARKLKNHENILTHLFGFKHEVYGGTFIAMENYVCSLLDCPAITIDIEFDIKDIFKQISTGLKFMHDNRIAHCCLYLRSIVISTRGGTQELIYKISNFRQATEDASEIDLKADIEDLGYLLDKLGSAGIVTWPSVADEVLRVDMIDKMTKQNYKSRPRMKDVLTHPFLWTPHETLHFIVQIAKLLESKNKTILGEMLEKNSNKVFTTDWRGYIEKQILQELKSINFDKLPMRNIVGLIKTIRNLVRTFMTLKYFSLNFYFLECSSSNKSYRANYWNIRGTSFAILDKAFSTVSFATLQGQQLL